MRSTGPSFPGASDLVWHSAEKSSRICSGYNILEESAACLVPGAAGPLRCVRQKRAPCLTGKIWGQGLGLVTLSLNCRNLGTYST